MLGVKRKPSRREHKDHWRLDRYLLLAILVFGAAAVGLIFLSDASVASASAGPHGGYTPTIDGCAGCHRVHTSEVPRLTAVGLSGLCLSCHGGGSLGAYTDVASGVFTEMTRAGATVLGLRGGGFDHALMDSDLSGTARGRPATSIHSYDGSLGLAWGMGEPGTGRGVAGFPMLCISCHDPHGNDDYRMLREIATGAPEDASAPVTDAEQIRYTITDFGGTYFGEGRTSAFSMLDQYSQLTVWCKQCHTRLQADADSGITALADAEFAFRHMAGDSSLTCVKCHSGGISVDTVAITYNPEFWNHQVECMTCHVSHGSSATMLPAPTGFGASASQASGGNGSGFDPSTLLRLDGRGVCQACHTK